MNERTDTLIETPTAEKIFEVLGVTHAMRAMAVIVGEPGVGKTAALRAYADRMRRDREEACSLAEPNVWMMMAEPHASELRGFLIELGGVLGAGSEYMYRRATYLAGRIVRERTEKLLAAADGEPCMLIVDEAQYLGRDVLEQLRSLHDTTGLAVALAGNFTLHGKLAPLNALASRVAYRLELCAAERGDVDAIIGAARIADASVKRHLREMGAASGGLRNVARAIEQARELAGEGEPLRAKHFELAAMLAGAAS